MLEMAAASGEGGYRLGVDVGVRTYSLPKGQRFASNSFYRGHSPTFA